VNEYQNTQTYLGGKLLGGSTSQQFSHKNSIQQQSQQTFTKLENNLQTNQYKRSTSATNITKGPTKQVIKTFGKVNSI